MLVSSLLLRAVVKRLAQVNQTGINVHIALLNIASKMIISKSQYTELTKAWRVENLRHICMKGGFIERPPTKLAGNC